MYRIGVEAILGLSLRAGALHIDPCIPRHWTGFEATFKPSRTAYRIVVENPEHVSRGVTRVEVDGVDRTGQDIVVLDDGAEHAVRVVMGTPAGSAALSTDAERPAAEAGGRR